MVGLCSPKSPAEKVTFESLAPGFEIGVLASVHVLSLRLIGVGEAPQTPSNGSAFRDDGEDEDVVDEDVVNQMYEAVDQMGEDMPIDLGRNFEDRGGGGAKRGEVGGQGEAI
ncbi:unnamed protein product [Prunus armeniaca]